MGIRDWGFLFCRLFGIWFVLQGLLQFLAYLPYRNVNQELRRSVIDDPTLLIALSTLVFGFVLFQFAGFLSRAIVPSSYVASGELETPRKNEAVLIGILLIGVLYIVPNVAGLLFQAAHWFLEKSGSAPKWMTDVRYYGSDVFWSVVQLVVGILLAAFAAKALRLRWIEIDEVESQP